MSYSNVNAVNSEKLKIKFMDILRGMPHGDVIKVLDGSSKNAWILMRKLTLTESSTCGTHLADYVMSLSKMRVEWSGIKNAICAFHTTFCITVNGVPAALLYPSNNAHPMQKYNPRFSNYSKTGE